MKQKADKRTIDMFRTAYGEKPKITFEAPSGERSRTKQSMKQECDINFILGQFQRTGLVNHRNLYEGSYGEFEAMDLQEALHMIRDAEAMFATVPAVLRKRFGNDPQEFIAYVNDPANRKEMAEMGLLSPEAARAALTPATPVQEGAENGA